MSEYQAQVNGIFLAPDKGEPMVSHLQVLAVAGSGLEGDGIPDRYAIGRGAFSQVGDRIRHVTLISQQDIDIANSSLEVSFLPIETRRNILIDGMSAERLLGVRFHVGGAALEGVSICDPCARPDKLADKKGFKTAFKGESGELAGIRAAILGSGHISIGDAIIIDL